MKDAIGRNQETLIHNHIAFPDAMINARHNLTDTTLLGF